MQITSSGYKSYPAKKSPYKSKNITGVSNYTLHSCVYT